MGRGIVGVEADGRLEQPYRLRCSALDANDNGWIAQDFVISDACIRKVAIENFSLFQVALLHQGGGLLLLLVLFAVHGVNVQQQQARGQAGGSPACSSTPLELGTWVARRGSVSVAMRRARAKALKQASTTW